MDQGGCTLFILLPFPSHYLACFPLAREIERTGGTVTFVGTTQVKKLIEDEGFLFREIPYSTEYYITSFRGFISLFLQSLFDPTDRLVRYREWFKGVQSAKAVVEAIHPAKVYIDEHLWHFYPLVWKVCTNIELLNTKLSTKKKTGTPPLNSSFIPRNTLFSRFICELVWLRHLAYVRTREWVVRMALLGYDEDWFTYRLAQRNGVDVKSRINRKNCMYKSLQGISTLILAPSFFEFPVRARDACERYGNYVIERSERDAMPAFLQIQQDLNKLKGDGKKLIYCSFGTLGINKPAVGRFIDNLVAIVVKREEWGLVLVTGGAKVNFACDRIFALNRAPQLKMLSLCDLMITHGGLTSVKEGIQFKKPMLVYPTHDKSDQQGNAARVHFHRLGIRGKIGADSVDLIEGKMHRLLTSWSFPVIDTATHFEAT